MKIIFPVKAFLCLIMYTPFFHLPSYSQCANGVTPSTISYDTVLLGLGYSNFDLTFPQYDTNQVYLTFPQFDLSKGTLVKVDIETKMTVKFSYTLENQDNVSKAFAIKINRLDVISSPVLLTPFEKFQQKTVGSHLLPPSDGTNGSGFDFVAAGPLYAYKNAATDYQLTENLAGFMGNGQVNFNYETQTDLFPTGTGYLWNPTTQDSLYFKLTYHYCLTSLLPADITNFTAAKSPSGRLQLNWSSPNDLVGNRYELEKSSDGKNYTTFHTIISKSSAKNNYEVTYPPSVEDKNKVFFRIKQTEQDGSFKYSAVKSVALEFASINMKVYPTLTSNRVNIYFPYASKADYRVRIISVTGQIMQQSEFAKTNLIRFSLNQGMKSGLYIVSVVNKQTSETQHSKILIE